MRTLLRKSIPVFWWKVTLAAGAAPQFWHVGPSTGVGAFAGLGGAGDVALGRGRGGGMSFTSTIWAVFRLG